MAKKVTTVGYEKPFMPDLTTVAPELPGASAPDVAPFYGTPLAPRPDQGPIPEFLPPKQRDLPPATHGAKIVEGDVILGKDTIESIPKNKFKKNRTPQGERDESGRVNPTLGSYRDIFGRSPIGDPGLRDGDEGEEEDKPTQEDKDNTVITGQDLINEMSKPADPSRHTIEDIIVKTNGDMKKAFPKIMDEIVGMINEEDDFSDRVLKIKDKRSKLAAANAQSLLDEQREDFNRRQELLERSHKRIQAYDGLVREALERGVNPQNFWESRTTFAKIIGALSLGAGAFGGALTGTSNSALAVIQNAIKNDIEAQATNLGLLKDAAAMNRLGYEEQANLKRQRDEFVADQTQKRISVISNLLNNLNANSDKKLDEAQKRKAFNVGLAQWALKTEMEFQKEKSRLDWLKEAQARANLAKTRQEIAHAYGARTIPAGQTPLPGLEGTTFTFGDPKSKTQFLNEEGSMVNNLTMASNTITGLDDLVGWVKKNKLASATGFIGFPSKGLTQQYGTILSNMQAQVKNVHDAINGDTRITEKEYEKAQDVVGINLLEAATGPWGTSIGVLQNKVEKIKTVMLMLAEIKARKTYNQLSTLTNQGRSVRRAGAKLFGYRRGETVYDRNKRVYNTLKGKYGIGTVQGGTPNFQSPQAPAQRPQAPATPPTPARPTRMGGGL